MRDGRLGQIKTSTTLLRGGLDLVSPTLSLPTGYLKYSVNYEIAVTGGYTRVKGYERFDGRPAPSAATYTIVQINNFSNTPAVGGSVKQVTSLATGVVAALGANYLVLTKVTGTFDSTHDVMDTGLATLYGTAVTQTVLLTAKQRAVYLNAAADIYRADIEPVGGAAGFGACLGEFLYNDVMYAFRALAADHTKVGLWKSTAGGWSAITLPYEITFDTAVGTGTGGITPPAEGETMTGGISAKTAVLRRVMLATGAWRTAATTADGGRFIITAPSGAFTVGETVTFTGGATAKVRTVGTQITILAGGKYECVTGNFFGQASTIRVYGADGVNRCFEFDGTYYCPISTGAVTDTPRHIVVHRNCLMISISSSVVISETAQPYRFATGVEVPTGDTVSGLVVQPGSQQTGTLAVFCRGNLFMLYGVNTATFTLVPFNVGAGAIEYSMVNAGNTFFCNNEGVTTINTTINFGNFLSASLTSRILPFISQELTAIAECTLMRQKNQYRLFFTDGYGLYITLSNGKPLGCMPVYFPDVVYSTWESEMTNGYGASFFGSTSGYVMQLEKGTSFDGANIDAFAILNWDAMRSPRWLKAYKQASIEFSSTSYAAIQFSYQLGYGSPNIDPSLGYTLESATQGFSLWDSGSWDEGYWDGQQLGPLEVDMTGTGENVQVAIASSTDYIDSYTLNSITYHYLPRRMLR